MSEITLSNIPDGHIIAGYVAVAKVLDSNGKMYWATRMKDLNDMEAYGMMMNAVDSAREDIQAGRNLVEGDGD